MDSAAPVTIQDIASQKPPTTLKPITSLNELLAIRSSLEAKEDRDTSMLRSFFDPSDIVLRDGLVRWATLNFPNNYPLFFCRVQPPSICLDGQSRTFFFYILYLLKVTDFKSFFSKLDSRVEGIHFSFTLTESNRINIVASRS